MWRKMWQTVSLDSVSHPELGQRFDKASRFYASGATSSISSDINMHSYRCYAIDIDRVIPLEFDELE